MEAPPRSSTSIIGSLIAYYAGDLCNTSKGTYEHLYNESKKILDDGGEISEVVDFIIAYKALKEL
jgi:hypothetical protein